VADREKVYADDPAEMAKKWERQGAQWLHVVDLDGAFSGTSGNIDAVKAVCGAVDIPIQFGGGNRTIDAVTRAFDIGVSRVVLGTAALQSPALMREACERFGERIAVGIDARDGKVAVKGWRDVTETDAIDFGKRVAGLGAGLIIYTDIARDGMLSGPNRDALKKMADSVPIPVIASGGIASLADVREIARLAPDRIIGMIVGKALYEGVFTLRQALDIVAESVVPDR
jgi:phosphoribosylformimino-5-aminoimidazole carboxamide ribotide isomerase